ncbi:MAG: hypothetical protein U9P72_03510 [Campylobacterota bacterium]|nr:hypothetical protein [Campylobacterota bacterium]
MKKIILSVAVATMALSTTASALEDIKVNGEAKVWYETDNVGTPGDMFNKTDASAEVVFKLGMTGKQGDVSFGAELTQGSTMGLKGVLVNDVRTSANNLDNQTGTGDVYVSKSYIVAPVVADTIVKLGRQELNTPFAFTEKWNAQQNNFDAAVFVNSSVSNLTLIGAYVGQTNTAGDHKATQEFNKLFNGAFAAGALYKADSLFVNAWAYELPSVAKAFWADAGMSVGPVALKAYVAAMMPSDTSAAGADNTVGFALSGATDVSGIKLFVAASMVGEDGILPLGNVATGFKKTKLPTAGVYTDGVYTAQPGSTAVKVKAAGKVGSTGLALQAVSNTNSNDSSWASFHGESADALDTTEIDLIVSQKVGAFNLKGIVMHRMFADDTTDDASGGQHVRVVASVKF